jgi:hypothetical protein
MIQGAMDLQNPLSLKSKESIWGESTVWKVTVEVMALYEQSQPLRAGLSIRFGLRLFVTNKSAPGQ